MLYLKGKSEIKLNIKQSILHCENMKEKDSQKRLET